MPQDPPISQQPLPGVVLLRHDLPDGLFHYDLMLRRPTGEGLGLVTFRVTARVDDPSVGAFRAERIGDHRTDYLTFEGPIDGRRGDVRRMASGTARIDVETTTSFRAVVDFGAGGRVFEGTLAAGGFWDFLSRPISAGAPG